MLHNKSLNLTKPLVTSLAGQGLRQSSLQVKPTLYGKAGEVMRPWKLLCLIAVTMFCTSCDPNSPLGSGPEFLGAWELESSYVETGSRTYMRIYEWPSSGYGYDFQPNGYLTVRLRQWTGAEYPQFVNRDGTWEQEREGILALKYNADGGTVTDRLYIHNLDSTELRCRVARSN